MNKRRKRAVASLSKDIEEHIQHETDDNIALGMPPEEARHAAIRKFGNRTAIQEEVHAVWTVVWLEQLVQDLRYALRTMRRNTGFTIVAVLTLMLGIGMTTAVFSVLDTLLIRPLPYPDADRLVWISHACLHSSGDCFMARSDYAVYVNVLMPSTAWLFWEMRMLQWPHLLSRPACALNESAQLRVISGRSQVLKLLWGGSSDRESRMSSS